MSQCLESGDLYLTIIRQMAAECEAGMAQFSRGQRGHWAEWWLTGWWSSFNLAVFIAPYITLTRLMATGNGCQNNDTGHWSVLKYHLSVVIDREEN